MKKMDVSAQRKVSGGNHYLCTTKYNHFYRGKITCGEICDNWFSWKWHCAWSHNSYSLKPVGGCTSIRLSW